MFFSITRTIFFHSRSEQFWQQNTVLTGFCSRFLFRILWLEHFWANSHYYGPSSIHSWFIKLFFLLHTGFKAWVVAYFFSSKKCKAKIYTFTLFSADATMYFFCPLRKFSITNLIAHIINYIYSIVAYKATVYKTGTRAISTSCTLTHGFIQVIKDNLIVLLTSFSLKFSLYLILR